MCDEWTERDIRRNPALTRRRFGAAAFAALAAGALPGAVHGARITDREVRITTPDGQADGFFTYPVGPVDASHPGILMWPDIVGLRPAFRTMARRIAGFGYAVLVVNPYYRTRPAPVVAEGETFATPGVRERLLGLAGTLSPATTERDAHAFVAWLDRQPEVDGRRKLATLGYCMTGPFTLRTAAAEPGRIAAGASFHGARMVTDGADSPHRLIPKIKAEFLIAIAENDDERDPGAKVTLAEAFRHAAVPAEIEVYEGALHGWCALDSQAYDPPLEERAWLRLKALLQRTLA